MSLFADDSAMMVGTEEEIGRGRQHMKDYERSTASKLHDKKTMVMRLGKMKQRMIDHKKLNVEFTIMKNDDQEPYLGDIIGNTVTESERFDEKVEMMEGVGRPWHSLKLGYYGKAIIANTKMLSKVLFRSQVNPVSEQMRKKVKEEIKQFMWGYKKQGVAWTKMMLPVAEGGVGLRDPGIVFDMQLIRLIKLMHTKADQPWVKWFLRKKKRRADLWKCKSNLFGYEPSKKQIEELNQGCLFESMLKVWFKLGGTTEERRVMAKYAPKGEVLELALVMREQRGEASNQVGFEVDGVWHKLEQAKPKLIYDAIWKSRSKESAYKVKRGEKRDFELNLAMVRKKSLTPKERDYWFRLAHGRVYYKNRESRWRREEGQLVSSTCPACRAEVETKSHYNYDCKVVQKFITLLEKVYEEAREEKEEAWVRPDRASWNLEIDRELSETMIILIAKARWAFHKERCKRDNKGVRNLDLEVVVDRVKAAMARTQSQFGRENDNKDNGKET